MEASLDRGHAALQKAHRGFLLKLDGLVGKRRGARTSP
jgi:hypothetical protein